MLDIRFIRENADLVKKSAAEKGIDVDVDKLLKLHDEHGAILKEVEELRAARNQLAGGHKSGTPDQASIEKGRQIKTQLNQKEKELKENEEWQELLWDIPNVIPDDTPSGGEEANRWCI